MVIIMESMDLLNAVVGADAAGRCKTTVAFFVEKDGDNADDSLIDEFYAEKPIIQMSEYGDAAGNEYYCIEFVYKSRRDEDLRQQWLFLERFVERVNSDSASDEIVLTVSFIPKSLDGKYSILAKDILPDSMIRVEYAGNNACSIRVLVLKENVLFLAHDEKLIDKRYLEAEVAREIDAGLAEEYGPLENNKQ